MILRDLYNQMLARIEKFNRGQPPTQSTPNYQDPSAQPPNRPWFPPYIPPALPLAAFELFEIVDTTAFPTFGANPSLQGFVQLNDGSLHVWIEVPGNANNLDPGAPVAAKIYHFVSTNQGKTWSAGQLVTIPTIANNPINLRFATDGTMIHCFYWDHTEVTEPGPGAAGIITLNNGTQMICPDPDCGSASGIVMFQMADGKISNQRTTSIDGNNKHFKGTTSVTYTIPAAPSDSAIIGILFQGQIATNAHTNDAQKTFALPVGGGSVTLHLGDGLESQFPQSFNPFYFRLRYATSVDGVTFSGGQNLDVESTTKKDAEIWVDADGTLSFAWATKSQKKNPNRSISRLHGFVFGAVSSGGPREQIDDDGGTGTIEWRDVHIVRNPDSTKRLIYYRSLMGANDRWSVRAGGWSAPVDFGTNSAQVALRCATVNHKGNLYFLKSNSVAPKRQIMHAEFDLDAISWSALVSEHDEASISVAVVSVSLIDNTLKQRLQARISPSTNDIHYIESETSFDQKVFTDVTFTLGPASSGSGLTIFGPEVTSLPFIQNPVSGAFLYGIYGFFDGSHFHLKLGRVKIR
jgi:hypothetical protein